MTKVIVKFRKARPFWFGHPWVFSGAVDRVKGQVEDGDIVELCDHEGKLIGHGFFNSKSQIRVRLVSQWFEGPITPELLIGRLERAVSLRRQGLRLDAVTNAYRVVHSEGDGLPGFIVDRMGSHLVIQVTSLGIARFVPALVARLVEMLQPTSVIERASRVGIEEEGLQRSDTVHFGTPPEDVVEVNEHGLRHWVDIRSGQKTGFYCDQRDNRQLVRKLCAGRDVLDAFSYVGPFGLQALKEGARSVHFLDSSGPALALAQRAAQANDVADRATFEELNVLRALEHYSKSGRTFDVVILDPPKFVHRLNELERGLRLYFEVNEKAVKVLRDGGLLVTCSCSQHVSESAFEDVLANVAKESEVRLQLVERGGQPGDHPMLLPHAESRYLKCHVYRLLRTKVAHATPAPAFGPGLDPA